jgi:hypothetical protein
MNMSFLLSFFLKNGIVFIIFFGVFLVCCYIGDDDVLYKFHDRKPTPAEGIASLRYALTKGIASLYGGGLLAVFVGKIILEKTLLIKVSGDEAVLLALVGFLFFNFVITWAIQNLIRRYQGRQLRPLVDKPALKILYRQWFGRRF